MSVNSYLSGFVLEAPSRASANPFGHQGQLHLDPEFLDKRIDSDEVEHLREAEHPECSLLVTGHPTRFKWNDQHMPEDQLPIQYDDFRDHLDDCECECLGEQTCIKCCTQADLLAFPGAVKVNVRRGLFGEVFDLQLQAIA